MLIFIIAIPDHWCHVLPDQTHLLAQSEAARLLPRQDDAPDTCYRYNLDCTSLINRTNLNLTGHSELGKVACQAWQYNRTYYYYARTYYHDTIVTDWDLVCSRDFLPTLAFLVNTAGTVLLQKVGTPLGGFLADRIGRKRTYLFSSSCRFSSSPYQPGVHASSTVSGFLLL
ncbi:solute carrier family 22 member 6-like [Paramacrobiotus metropolitanus]|uniref:solute carrier family 22 member 6-like n=1 Tax=Paramacrobiotus metropolitanus TaxID=2943436 RepID=UPI002446392F|nr:solute carrier family 22 member 6-like [Paramacrobiotus metropolitanus]